MTDRTLDDYRKYLRYTLNVPKEKEQMYISAMGKYSECWWISDNFAKIAKYQMNESLLLVPFIKLQNSLEAVLKRSVAPDEIHYTNDALRAEVEAATA